MEALLAIPAAAWNTGGAFVFLTLLFVGLQRGSLVTRREHEGRLADKDKAIETLEKAVGVKDDQIEKLSIVHEFQKKVWSAVERAVEKSEERETP